MLAVVVFTLWGSGEVQPWNDAIIIDNSTNLNKPDAANNKKSFPETYQIIVFIVYNSLLILLFTYM